MSQHVERRATESLLRLIAEGTAPAIGEEFFRSLVRHLAEALGVNYAFVAEFAGVRTRVRTLAFWARHGSSSTTEPGINELGEGLSSYMTISSEGLSG